MARKVLVVDDNEIDRQILTNILSRQYDVLEAENGKEAIAILRQRAKAISAVLLDMMMPVMDGREVLLRMMDNAIWSQIPIIVTTAMADEETQEKVLRLGANSFVTKPYNKTVILSILRNSIRLRETASIMNSLRKDKLTGLYNREAFFELAENMINTHEPGTYVLSCFDIDGFKVINDQYGIEKGDEVLKHVANSINKWVTSLDGICCRFTGDKYAVLYPAAYKNTRAIVESHNEAMTPDCITRGIKIRIGRYTIDDTTLSVSAMYDRAALAERSIKGKYNTYIAEYTESMRESLLREQRIVNEMHYALKGGQFEPWFQPQFNHATGAMIGAEALVRWRKPDDGRLVSPSEFIPVFERNGFIYELDKYVWEQVCIILRRWLDTGRAPLPVSVNISRYDIFRDDFIDIITGLAEKYSIPLGLLRLEVTESAFSESADQIVSAIKSLIEYGFVVEIDDFGSGYSSLNTLKDVPATILKLDMKFLENTSDSQRSGNILESVVRMTKWLGMIVIAEGVETREQADYLKSIGCFYMQGYLYARPMPLNEYEALWETSTGESDVAALDMLKRHGTNAFWDPKSVETLIFNSYVGGACIFEYYNGKSELLRVNDNYIRQLGVEYKPGESLSVLDIENYLDYNNHNVVNDNIQCAIETGKDSSCEFKLSGLNSDAGSVMHFKSTVRVIARTEDRYLLYCVIDNITAQRQAEQKGREAEKKRIVAAEHLKAIMNSINAGVSAMSIDDGIPRLQFANDEFYRLYGYTKEQFDSEVLNPFNLIHADDRENVEALAQASCTSLVHYTVAYRIIRRDQTVRWVQSNISFIVIPDVNLPVQLAVTNDITDQKEVDELLRFLSATARDLLSKADDCAGVQVVLQKLLDFFDGSGAFVFERTSSGKEFTAEHRLCVTDDGREQRVLTSDIKSLIDSFDREECVTIEDVCTLDEKSTLRRLLNERGVASLLAIPLYREGGLRGFIVVENPHRTRAQAKQLAVLGDYVALAIERARR